MSDISVVVLVDTRGPPRETILCKREHRIMYVDLRSWVMVQAAKVNDVVMETSATVRVPVPCTDLNPLNLLEEAMPRIGQLPDGVSVVYDAKSHAHAFQFMQGVADVQFPAAQIFQRCGYFPEEFSIFFILKHGRKYENEECIVNIRDIDRTSISISITNSNIIFIYDSQPVKFRNYVFRDNNWHTVGFSVTGNTVSMTTDCLNIRRKRLKRQFPSFLMVSNSTIHIASCRSRKSALKGMLKDLLLIPGADAATKACPPRVPRHIHHDNNLPMFPDFGGLDTPGPKWEDCTWMSVGNLAFDLYSQSLKVCINGIWKQISIRLAAQAKKKLDYLEAYQNIETMGPSIDVELFSIPGEGLFSVFANSGGNSETHHRKKSVSGLYQWADKKFRLYQKLTTDEAQSWCSFWIGNQFYLAVANYGLNPTHGTNSTIFRWHRRRKKFRVHQDILTWTARDFEYFQNDDDHFLVVANHAKGSTQEVDSIIYKWNKREKKFKEHQAIPTVGAYDWTYFTVDSYQFLAVAQAFNGLSTMIDSRIFLRQGDQFIQFQTMETNGATDWEFFKIGQEYFLVVANAYNYGPQNFKSINTYRTNSTIYKLNIQKKVFERFQSIATDSAIDWEHFTVGDNNYIIVSNAQNGDDEENNNSLIYRWQGMDKFVLVHKMAILPSADWEVFQDGDDMYMIYANPKGKISQVLKVKYA
ncbi:hypothetical protein ScPMuIL_017337 [Solemya velum]